jgi:hypothetical protein
VWTQPRVAGRNPVIMRQPGPTSGIRSAASPGQANRCICRIKIAWHDARRFQRRSPLPSAPSRSVARAALRRWPWSFSDRSCGLILPVFGIRRQPETDRRWFRRSGRSDRLRRGRRRSGQGGSWSSPLLRGTMGVGCDTSHSLPVWPHLPSEINLPGRPVGEGRAAIS